MKTISMTIIVIIIIIIILATITPRTYSLALFSHFFPLNPFRYSPAASLPEVILACVALRCA
jgi:hypothetical protein